VGGTGVCGEKLATTFARFSYLFIYYALPISHNLDKYKHKNIQPISIIAGYICYSLRQSQQPLQNELDGTFFIRSLGTGHYLWWGMAPKKMSFVANILLTQPLKSKKFDYPTSNIN
jgi:hypothetical protein